jgi:hypothetical protein
LISMSQAFFNAEGVRGLHATAVPCMRIQLSACGSVQSSKVACVVLCSKRAMLGGVYGPKCF